MLGELMRHVESLRVCLTKERKWGEKNWIDFYFHKYIWMKKMRGKEIEEELFSFICLQEKVREKKKIIILNDNFTLISF